MNRSITCHYQDPLEIVWLVAARKCGIEIVRDPEVFAAWNGSGTLRIGTTETLDADDSLAQMILHEMCHALVEGPDAMEQPDWGLVYDEVEHRVHEQACLRLQAALADEVGLRRFFASTTDYREYYDRIPKDALADESDPATRLARDGMRRANSGNWSAPIRQALQQTAALAQIVASIADGRSVWSGDS